MNWGNAVYLCLTKLEMMKKSRVLFVLALILFSACTVPKSYYLTKEGKKKQRYYNDIQFGGNAHPKKKF